MTTTSDQNVATQRDLKHLADELGEMKELMRRMTEAMQRITVIDERIAMMQKFHDRVERRLDTVEKSVRDIYIDYERDKTRVQTTIWLVRAMWAAGGAAAFAWVLPILQKGAGQ